MREISHMVLRPEARALAKVDRAPRLTAAACEVLREVEVLDEYGVRRPIEVPVERSLTLLVDGVELVTLMTLGASPEFLVLGYLFNQRLITGVTDVAAVEVDWDTGTAKVLTRAGEAPSSPAPPAKAKGRTGSSGCGLGTVLGSMGQLDTTRFAAAVPARLSQRGLYALLEVVSEQESLHRTAGSVHGCALFRGAELLAFVEDVARHNAIDTLTGWMAVHGVGGGDKILYTTGRLSGEMVIKAAQSGVPILVSRNGVTAMGLDVARELRMTLIGRAVKRRFFCYAGADRFDAEPESSSATKSLVSV